MKPTNNAEAEAMLKALSEYFKQPVLPVSRYCAALEMWQSALRDRSRRLRVELFPGLDSDDRKVRDAAAERLFVAKASSPVSHEVRQLTAYEQASAEVDRVFLSIKKSSLLHRLLYAGEKLRTKPCPTHQGKWSGIDWENTCACQRTGWLPEEPSTPPVRTL